MHGLAVCVRGAAGGGGRSAPGRAGRDQRVAGQEAAGQTDREDARWLRTLLAEGRLPEAWIPPAHVREWRTRARLRKTLVDERTRWLQRVQATLFHYGISGAPDKLLSAHGREFLDRLELPDSACERVEVALAMIEALDRQLAPLEQALRRLPRRQTRCRALMAHYGIGYSNDGPDGSRVTRHPPAVVLGLVLRLAVSRHRSIGIVCMTRRSIRCLAAIASHERVERSSRRSIGDLPRVAAESVKYPMYTPHASARGGLTIFAPARSACPMSSSTCSGLSTKHESATPRYPPSRATRSTS